MELVGDASHLFGRVCLSDHRTSRPWLTDKTQVLYFSSRFLILKNKTRLAALFILLL
jgi:hypothetical protein